MGKIIVLSSKLNFIEEVVKDIINKDNLENTTVVFTHKRPIIYFKYHFSNILKGINLLPKMYSFEDWIDYLFLKYGGNYSNYLTLSDYDEAYLSYLAVKDVLELDIDWNKFFFWSIEISNIIKELDLELVYPQNILYPPDGKIPKIGIEILSKLEKIYIRFEYYLSKYKAITKSKKLKILSEYINKVNESSFVIFVGFFALTASENRILKKFYEKGSYFYWQIYDDAARNLPPIYKEWLDRWNISFSDLEIRYPCTEYDPRPDIYFFEAHDLHSGLSELKKRIQKHVKEIDSPLNTAIIIPDPSNLLPVVWELSSYPLNITMGYPFFLTGIFSILSSLFDLILSSTPSGSFSYTSFIKFLREFYLLTGQGENLLRVLSDFSDQYFTIEDLENILDNNTLLELYILKKIIIPIDKNISTSQLANYIKDIIYEMYINNLLSSMEKEIAIWIIANLIPTLESFLFSEEKMEISKLFYLFLNMCSEIRIPFEGEPLQGIQIMGILEARTLNFKNIYVLDANEGILPCTKFPSPIFPQQIREIMNFPHRRREEEIYEFHFYRLLYSANNVNIFYQSKESADVYGNKMIRSRYIEKLIWDIEKENNKLIIDINLKEKSDIDIFSSSQINLCEIPFFRGKNILDINLIKNKIREKLSKINISLLSMYISCPLKFIYNYILELDDLIDKKIFDPAEFGNIIHKSLYIYFSKLKSKNSNCIKKEDLSLNDLFNIFLKEFNSSKLINNVSLKEKNILLNIVKYRFSNYIKNHPSITSIIYLEKKLSTIFNIKDKKLVLDGRLDRIDKRDDIYIILDYKTGYIPKFRNLIEHSIEIPTILDREQFINFSELIGDIQLPFYIFLFARQYGGEIPFEKIAGAFVDLSSKGEERFWIPPSRLSADSLDIFFSHTFPSLLGYIITHIFDGPVFGIPSSRCKWCNCREVCDFSI